MAKCQNCKHYENCMLEKHCSAYTRLEEAAAWQIAKDFGLQNWTQGMRIALEHLAEREMEVRLEREI